MPIGTETDRGPSVRIDVDGSVTTVDIDADRASPRIKLERVQDCQFRVQNEPATPAKETPTEDLPGWLIDLLINLGIEGVTGR